jgi:hypothetical protein
MNLRTIAALSTVVALLSGCATGPSMSEVKTPLPTLSKDMGRVYFYRTGVIGGAYQPEVTLNGNVVGKAVPRGVYFKDVPPGSYKVTTSMTKETVNFALAVGQKQYIKLSYSFGFNIYPEVIEASVGETEIQDLSYIASN